MLNERYPFEFVQVQTLCHLLNISDKENIETGFKDLVVLGFHISKEPCERYLISCISSGVVMVPIFPSCSDSSYDECTHPKRVFCCGWCNSTNLCIEDFWMRWCEDLIYTDSMKSACATWRAHRHEEFLKLTRILFWIFLIILSLLFPAFCLRQFSKQILGLN